jgi:hypothetical protein
MNPSSRQLFDLAQISVKTYICTVAEEASPKQRIFPSRIVQNPSRKFKYLVWCVDGFRVGTRLGAKYILIVQPQDTALDAFASSSWHWHGILLNYQDKAVASSRDFHLVSIIATLPSYEVYRHIDPLPRQVQ